MESLVDSFTGTSGRPSVSARPAVEPPARRLFGTRKGCAEGNALLGFGYVFGGPSGSMGCSIALIGFGYCGW